MNIHRTAVVDKGAELADNVEVGPYCIIRKGARIGAGTKLGPHCVVFGDTTIGKNNVFTAGASVGADPQDLKYKGARTYLEIGDGNTFREYVTLNRATGEGEKTVVGNNGLFMAYSHVAHNCAIGNRVIVANCGSLAGHVTIEDNAIIGGLVGIHQFCRIGKLAIAGGCSKVVGDIAPFMMTDGQRAEIRGINRIGLERAGVGRETIGALTKAYKILFRNGLPASKAVREIENRIKPCPEIEYLLQFVKSCAGRPMSK